MIVILTWPTHWTREPNLLSDIVLVEDPGPLVGLEVENITTEINIVFIFIINIRELQSMNNGLQDLGGFSGVKLLVRDSGTDQWLCLTAWGCRE